MKTFFRLLGFSKPYHHYVPEYIVYVTLYTIFGLINFTLLVPLLDVLFNTKTTDKVTLLPKFTMSISYFKDLFYYELNLAIQHSNTFGVLLYVCAAIFFSVLLKNVFGYLGQRVLTRMRVNLVKTLRERLFHQFSHQSLQFYHNEKKGDLLATISGDVVEIENSIVNSIQTIFREPLMIIATFLTLFYLSPKLTLFTVLFFPISGIIISNISKKLRKKSKEGQNLLGVLLNLSEEAISGIRIIKSFNAEKFVDEKFNRENDHYRRLTKSLVNRYEMASPISETLGVLVIATVILFGGYLIISGKSVLSASAFIAYIALYFQILAPAKSIAGAISNMQRGLSAGERVLRILDTPQTVTEQPGATSITSFNREIVFNDVCFRYAQHNVLNNIKLSITKGKIIALVGNSGGGKSTLADLLPRFYDVSEGSISIDGKDIRSLKLKDLRNLVAIVSQEAILFNDTIYNNIAFGSEGASKEAVITAAKVANAHGFITEMENGFDTFIGDRGSKLSGGQRQRITIARAVLKNAPVLILDEATSALDSESEKLVQNALEHLMQNRTSIVIAHRLSTIRNADEIVVLQKGEIAERGTHEQLLAYDGIYKRLIEMQEVK